MGTCLVDLINEDLSIISGEVRDHLDLILV